MWSSRDIALVILLAVVSFVYSLFIGQLGAVFTGILGFNYFFIIGHAIFISFGFLMYEGRRWRFLLQTVLVALLTLPTFQSGAPFDILARMPMILGAFFSDLIFNSFYEFFRSRNRMVWWAILVGVLFLIITPFFMALTRFFFYTPEAFALYVHMYFILLPVTMIETVIGAYIAYRIFKRVKKPLK